MAKSPSSPQQGDSSAPQSQQQGQQSGSAQQQGGPQPAKPVFRDWAAI